MGSRQIAAERDAPAMAVGSRPPLRSRGLSKIRRRGRTWRGEITEAGRGYLETPDLVRRDDARERTARHGRIEHERVRLLLAEGESLEEIR